MRTRSKQEDFWSGAFGDDYIERNKGERLLSANISLFSRIFKHTTSTQGGVKSVIEFGANIGLNLVAINTLLPEVDISAVEINKKACDSLSKLDYVKTYNMSIYDFDIKREWDFVFTKGVLIHQNPALLPDVYERLYKASRKYIMVCEYYNPTPVEVNYRGNNAVLFKRDFAGELMDRYDTLCLIDYGFVYHRDTCFPQDDLTWFLMEKRD